MKLSRISAELAAQGQAHVMVIANADVTRLKPDSVVRVFHGTQNMETGIRAFLKSGIDGTKVVGRSYNQGAERGLYIAPNQRTARDFGGVVLEFDVKAKDLYPTARWGLGAGHRQKQTQEMAAERFPDSFRPLVSWQLTEKQEPQAMFIGFVPASKIIAVHVYATGSSVDFKTYTVQEARELFKARPTVDLQGDETYEQLLHEIAEQGGYTQEEILEGFAASDEEEIIQTLKALGLSRRATLKFVTEFRKRT